MYVIHAVQHKAQQETQRRTPSCRITMGSPFIAQNRTAGVAGRGYQANVKGVKLGLQTSESHEQHSNPNSGTAAGRCRAVGSHQARKCLTIWRPAWASARPCATPR